MALERGPKPIAPLKNALYLSVKVFTTKVLTGDTIFKFPTGNGTAILRGHPSHAKVKAYASISTTSSSIVSVRTCDLLLNICN